VEDWLVAAEPAAARWVVTKVVMVAKAVVGSGRAAAEAAEVTTEVLPARAEAERVVSLVLAMAAAVGKMAGEQMEVVSTVLEVVAQTKVTAGTAAGERRAGWILEWAVPWSQLRLPHRHSTSQHRRSAPDRLH
jgi:hypothetical protein